ncbi:immunity protein Imm33 domain-containing protein [Lacihabitans soyangensis]|uniref:Imm33-like domain-containing protein n=1 Tax=Lacihabitans soyangensis TaxID=869394 RepID=A0AAE3H515_9BACT|nr:hypothetical protein [Lacihabitans soyangensis]MCP9764141.1 hypothetical protein [Lacihabitans soyangensis]
MKVTRQDLIELCDKFLDNKIDKVIIQDFAWTAITDDDFEWQDDEIISETIFEWDNEDINFEINKTNISLWKKRLLTDKDDLLEHNFWNSHIDKQKEICKNNNSIWKPINKKLRVGVSINLDKDPINGLRHPAEKGTTGWFIWTGDYSEADDFFQPMCAEHLLQQRPEIIKYLGLDIGFRFLADAKGYEDIWYDEKLKTI